MWAFDEERRRPAHAARARFGGATRLGHREESSAEPPTVGRSRTRAAESDHAARRTRNPEDGASIYHSVASWWRTTADGSSTPDPTHYPRRGRRKSGRNFADHDEGRDSTHFVGASHVGRGSKAP